MKLNVHFVYEASIVKPKCRKPVIVQIRDSIEVEIREASICDLPIAFRDGSSELRWDGNSLYDFDWHTVANKQPVKVLAETVKANTEEKGANYVWSCAGGEAPFHNFWFGVKSLQGGYRTIDGWLKDEDVYLKESVAYREWVEDNRQAVVDAAQAIAGNLLVCDGLMYAKSSEPRYCVMSFGIGHSYSVSLHSTNHYSPNVSSKSYFSALEFEKAHASMVERGGDKAVSCEQIEVLIPEAVKLNPKADHVE